MIDESRRRSFGSVVEKYEAVRPDYPSELFDDLAHYAALSSKSRLLEIGTGTGKATVPFAEQGMAITCLEPDEKLYEFSISKLSEYSSVKVINEKFEDWNGEAESLDLIFSAQAFHWVPPEIAYPKAHSLLTGNGVLAFFWNLNNLDDREPGLRQEFDKIYQRFFPRENKTEGTEEQDSFKGKVEARLKEFRSVGLFEDIECRIYPWKCTYNSEMYIDLLDTYSDNRVLKESTRNSFYEEIRASLERNGGQIIMPYQTVLYMGKLCN